ncbi:FAD-dependent oxidoreductase [Rhizorhabdus sp. FW153]|uniref:FAD-dependent oxidoreductase n=1 Tax=Rhizorhabdus sp. FW153 TaxID=3400216 RepID=UPI003CF9C7B9
MGARRIAVAGCGVAGLATALLLSRAGEQVELFERFDRPQPVGSGLMIQPTGMVVLERLGLADRICEQGARIDRLYGMAAHRVVLDVSYAAMAQPGLFGVGVHRACLFADLHDAVAAQGIPVHGGVAITGSQIHRDKRVLLFEDGRTSDGYDLIVDGLGSRSTLAPPSGYDLPYGALWASLDWPNVCHLDAHCLTQRYRRSSKMAGILPLGSGGGGRNKAAFFWSLKQSDLPVWREAGVDAWKEEVRRLWPECEPFLGQIDRADQLTFARYAHRTVAEPRAERLVHIGDSWHSASPQLGQGANMALLDAWALSAALARHTDLDEALQVAVASRRRHVRLYQWLTWAFTPIYQSDSRMLPIVRDWIMGPISKLWPIDRSQAMLVSGLFGNPLGPLGLEGPRLRSGA